MKVCKRIWCIISFAAAAAAAGMVILVFLCNIRPAVVVSGSMEPEIMTGSLCFIDYKEKKAEVGDIIAYEKEDMRIIHRVLQKNDDEYITKGDNNDTEDIAPVHEKQIMGRALFSLPYLGYSVMVMKTKAGFTITAVLIFIVLLSGFSVKKTKKHK